MQTTRRGYILPLIALSIIVIFASVVAVLLFLKDKSSEPTNNTQKSANSTEKLWKGILLTKDGLIKIDDHGVFEKKEGKAIIYPIPGIKLTQDYNPFTLREDGQLLIIGSPNYQPALRPNVIYKWRVASNENFEPLFTVENGKKIQSFAFSPDYKQIAITYVTRTSSEILDGIDSSKISTEEVKKELAERERVLQEELRTVTIYDAKTFQTVKSLQLPLPNGRSRRTGAPSLIWNKKGLFTEEAYEIIIFDANSWKEIGKIKNDNSIAGLAQAYYLVISPDGSSYYNTTTLEVKSIPDNKLIAKLNAPEFITQNQINENTQEDKIVHPGFAAFSNDSKKVIVTGTSLRGVYLIIWELNLEKGETQQIGDLYSLDFGENIDYQWKKTFTPIQFTPNDERIIFNLYQEKEHTVGRLDYFAFKLGDKKTDYHERFTRVTGFPDLGNLSFLGWYFN